MNGASLQRKVANAAVPVAFGVGFVVLWEFLVRWRDIKQFILPRPSMIWKEAVNNAGFLRSAATVSGTNALVGLVCGIIIGCAVAMIANRFKILAELVTPLSAAISAIPIVVIVSILNNMFRIGSEVPRRLMVTIVVFFVVFVNVARGLRQSNSTQMELMRSYAASPSQVMKKVRFPNALPFLFTAIKIAAPLAVTTAFVSEYFGGTQDGLGQKIPAAMANSKDPLGWAYVGAACVLGLGFFIAANVLEYVAVPWQRARNSG